MIRETPKTDTRRACALRAAPEADVDSPQGKHKSPPQHTGYPFTLQSGGRGSPDNRSLTIDCQARLWPQSSGMHKGGVGQSPERSPQSKSESVRSMQALGIGYMHDADLIMSRKKQIAGPPRENQTKIESIQGMPLSGRGADISLVGHRRRCQPSQACKPSEEKQVLDNISIDHQFHRRLSSPPKSQECKAHRESEHTILAKDYARTIGRPVNGRSTPLLLGCLSESVMHSPLPSPRLSPRQRPRSIPSTHAQASCKAGKQRDQEIHEQSSPEQPAALIEALRDATRNTPAEPVWDAMLNALSESPQLFSHQAQEATRNLLAEVASGQGKGSNKASTMPAVSPSSMTTSAGNSTKSSTTTSPRPSPKSSPLVLSSPAKESKWNWSPSKSDRELSLGRPGSDASFRSSTTVDTDGRTEGHYSSSEVSSKVASPVPPAREAIAERAAGGLHHSSPRSKNQSMDQLRAAQQRARRRAAWIV